MFEQLRVGIFHSRWNFLRIIQLVLSVLVVVQAITDHHFVLIIPALFILYMALSNSCQACQVPSGTNSPAREKVDVMKDIEYIEIKDIK